MKRKLIIYPLLLCSFILGCNAKKQSELDIITSKTCAYLWSQQQSDGSWRSATHGLLKNGIAYTPFILYALLKVPDEIYPKSKEKINKSLAFIRENIRENGIMGKSDFVLEYPNYATAYALMVLTQFGEDKDKALIEKMKHYLIQQQFDENRNISPTHPAYGGWGFGETRLGKGEVGHVDLSNTRRVLEALQIASSLQVGIKQKAKAYLRISQKHPEEKRVQPDVRINDSLKTFYDGGFYYSTAITAANKAKQAPQTSDLQAYYRSYATATCDGILALFAIGEKEQDEAIQSAKKWLLTNPQWEYPAGIPTEDPDQWHLVMVFYHIAVRAEAYQKLHIKGNWKKEVLNLLKNKQNADGSFANPLGARNKENDPLLASTFALIALSKMR